MFRSTLAPESACSRAGPPGYQMSSHTLTPTRPPSRSTSGAPGEHGAGVVQVSVEVDEADSGHHVLRNLPSELAESPHVLLYKARAHQEVLGRIAGDGQLGIGDEIRA